MATSDKKSSFNDLQPLNGQTPPRAVHSPVEVRRADSISLPSLQESPKSNSDSGYILTGNGPALEAALDLISFSVDGCWNWAGRVRTNGYGMFRKDFAHRVVYALLVGEIPAGLEIDHLCRNRRCVRPDHLEPVTTAVNVMRGEGAGARNARKTHCVRGHEFTQDNTFIGRYRRFGRPTQQRWCRECWRIRAAAKRAKAKAEVADTADFSDAFSSLGLTVHLDNGRSYARRVSRG